MLIIRISLSNALLTLGLTLETENPNVEDRGGLWEVVSVKEVFTNIKRVPLLCSIAHIFTGIFRLLNIT